MPEGPWLLFEPAGKMYRETLSQLPCATVQTAYALLLKQSPYPKLANLNKTIVIATKAYANKAIALELKDKAVTGPGVIIQNGVGVEKPFLDAHFSPISATSSSC